MLADTFRHLSRLPTCGKNVFNFIGPKTCLYHVLGFILDNFVFTIVVEPSPLIQNFSYICNDRFQ